MSVVLLLVVVSGCVFVLSSAFAAAAAKASRGAASKPATHVASPPVAAVSPAAAKPVQVAPKVPKPASKPKPASTTTPVVGNGKVPSYDTMSQPLLQKLFAQVTATPRVLYSFKKGSDGLLYWIESTAPPGWLDTIVAMRKSVVAALAHVSVAPNGVISRLDDARLSENEFKSVCRAVNQTTVSAIASISGDDTGFYGVCSSQNNTVPACGSGCLCMLTSKDYAGAGSKGWKQENITYLIHELSHAALSGPDEKVAHGLEFFRVQHILCTAAAKLGKSVYDPAWYAWDPATPGVREGLGSQIGTDRWWKIQQELIIKEKKHFDGANLVPGADPVISPAVTGVNITANSPGAMV